MTKPDPDEPINSAAPEPTNPVQVVPEIDEGLYHFLPLDQTDEWLEVRIRDGKLFRLVAIDEGIELIHAPGSFHGPLRMPTLAFVKVH